MDLYDEDGAHVSEEAQAKPFQDCRVALVRDPNLKNDRYSRK
jgi:hypothetical protein